MEFVEGESLRRVLNRFNALSARTAIKIASQICDGLREAHAQGIVHRDLKPENLMIDGSGNVKLMDFGLAHLVAEGSTAAVGTPSYMAPEQAQGAAVDQRCDIYALGLVLFEMFTGRERFHRRDADGRRSQADSRRAAESARHRTNDSRAHLESHSPLSRERSGKTLFIG